MGASVHVARSLRGSTSCACLLEFPFDSYTDSPDVVIDGDVCKTSASESETRVDDDEVAGSGSQWRRGLAGWNMERDEAALPLLSEEQPSCKQRLQRSWWSQYMVRAIVVFFVMLGIIQFISLACGIVLTFFPDECDRAAQDWMHRTDERVSNDRTHWPTDISRNIVPVGCHSHNDYWRRVPLHSALQAGCIGVEADVWLFDNELYVGHTTSSLTPRRTLRSMYIDPLVNLLERQNPVTRFQSAPAHPPHGVFDTDPEHTLVLLIDFKTDGAATWPVVTDQLASLRERGYLTHFNGRELITRPITIVATGNAPFNLLAANTTYRDIFFDAPLNKLVDSDTSSPSLDQEDLVHARFESHAFTTKKSKDLGQGMSGMPTTITANTFNITNSYYASVSFKSAIGFPWPFHFTQRQIDLIRAQVHVAHRRGLKVRYWGLPSWPRSLRNHIWRVLVREGVDILNVDDLVDATKGEWRIRVLDWWI